MSNLYVKIIYESRVNQLGRVKLKTARHIHYEFPPHLLWPQSSPTFSVPEMLLSTGIFAITTKYKNVPIN